MSAEGICPFSACACPGLRKRSIVHRVCGPSTPQEVFLVIGEKTLLLIQEEPFLSSQSCYLLYPGCDARAAL